MSATPLQIKNAPPHSFLRPFPKSARDLNAHNQQPKQVSLNNIVPNFYLQPNWSDQIIHHNHSEVHSRSTVELEHREEKSSVPATSHRKFATLGKNVNLYTKINYANATIPIVIL